MGPKGRAVADNHFRQILVAGGFRVTGQRMQVLRELAKLRTPISHAELAERLTDTPLDRVTIYRNLLSLTEAGVLVRTQLGDGVWRYELPQTPTAEHGKHPHFVCTDCGDIACLPANTVSIRGVAARNQVAEVQLRGRCSACVRG
jgi:Fur family transcriptional regulator, ferric uptake regulator